jgi:hypothetical protein
LKRYFTEVFYGNPVLFFIGLNVRKIDNKPPYFPEFYKYVKGRSQKTACNPDEENYGSTFLRYRQKIQYKAHDDGYDGHEDYYTQKSDFDRCWLHTKLHRYESSLSLSSRPRGLSTA